MDSIGDIIGLLIIVGVVVLKAIGSALSGQQKKPAGAESRESGSDDTFSWEDWGWEPPASASQPETPKPPPVPKSQPAPRPVAAEAQYAEPVQESFYGPVGSGFGGGGDSYAWDAPAAPEAPAPPEEYHQPYQSSTGVHAQTVEQLTPGANTGDLSGSSIANQSFQYAFPEAMKKVRRLKRGTRKPIMLSIKGRRDIRRGVLLREVLMHPRAYDI